ncbi:MAG: hypothetical protein E6Q97_36060 [Desulfurellales bacterium]|nr:MAG: hypothetical protein E6Q97_36060 [Desulfurellales bacterium]
MSETQATETKAVAKSKVEYEKITMTDGREVQFAGKRKMTKDVVVDEANGTVNVRFDFRNGQTLSIGSADLSRALNLQALGHGLSQKCGDNAAGVDEIDDMVIAVEDVIKQLKGGDWSAAREAGDSTAGASVVIKAIAEVTGKSIDFVKEFLQKKLDAAKAAGQKLSRQDLYASFRRPDTPTGQVIKRLEEEKLAKASKVDTSSLLAEIGG